MASAQGVGYDHDSIGLFQQRPPWGTAAQRMDPISSTNLFLDALLAVRGWSSMEPWPAPVRRRRTPPQSDQSSFATTRAELARGQPA